MAAIVGARIEGALALDNAPHQIDHRHLVDSGILDDQPVDIAVRSIGLGECIRRKHRLSRHNSRFGRFREGGQCVRIWLK